MSRNTKEPPMRSRRARLITTLVFVSMLWFAAPAHAGWQDEIDLGVQGLGFFGGNFLSEPSDKTVEQNGRRYSDVIYPGFGGTGKGGGFTLDFRYQKIIGLEIGCIFSEESAKGEINELNLTLSHAVTHVPIMLKVAANTEIVRPFAMVGWQFSFVSDAKAEFEGGGTLFDASNEDYSLFAFGFGLEVALPLDGVDIRIPLAVRLGWNTSTTDKVSDRAEYDIQGNTIQKVTFSTAFEYHAGGTLGIAWYFL